MFLAITVILGSIVLMFSLGSLLFPGQESVGFPTDEENEAAIKRDKERRRRKGYDYILETAQNLHSSFEDHIQLYDELIVWLKFVEKFVKEFPDERVEIIKIVDTYVGQDKRDIEERNHELLLKHPLWSKYNKFITKYINKI